MQVTLLMKEGLVALKHSPGDLAALPPRDTDTDAATLLIQPNATRVLGLSWRPRERVLLGGWRPLCQQHTPRSPCEVLWAVSLPVTAGQHAGCYKTTGRLKS